MASDSLDYWTKRLASASTIEEKTKCSEYVAYYEDDAAFTASLKARYHHAPAAQPFSMAAVLWFPFYAFSLLIQAAVMTFGWMIFSFIIIAVIFTSANELWHSFISQFGY
jgi:hypothetical protein